MARTVVNALGDTLYYSGSSTGFFSATGSGPRLSALPAMIPCGVIAPST